MKTVGIVAHSAEGGALSFITACRKGGSLLGEHMHPEIVLSAIPMALSMPGWNNDNHEEVAQFLTRGVEQVAQAGADFFICPDNTAHIVLEKIIDKLPLPGLHIADVVCRKIKALGYSKAALLGTEWTMTGPVYEGILKQAGIEKLIPDLTTRKAIHEAIFNELCNGVFTSSTTDIFVQAIAELKAAGAECVILGCTEIPLIINEDNSPLPILDSTRLQAKHAVQKAINDSGISDRGWL